MKDWAMDAVKVAGAILGILAFSFGFLYILIFVPWKRCRKICNRDDRTNPSVVEDQRPPVPYYTLINELCAMSPTNSPSLPTYEQCTRQTLPPTFEEAIGSEVDEAAPPYTPPESNTTLASEPSHPQPVFCHQHRTENPMDSNRQPCTDMCLHCSIPESPPTTRPPSYSEVIRACS